MAAIDIIDYVKMTNPEADCKQIGMGMGRPGNIVEVGWRNPAASALHGYSNGICSVFAASQAAVHGPFAVAPDKFVGRLRQIEVVYPQPTGAATPLSNYDIEIRRYAAATSQGADLAASALLNIPVKQASAKHSQFVTFDPPQDVHYDIRLYIRRTGATLSGTACLARKRGALRFHFE
jgi:hypothetical protein